MIIPTTFFCFVREFFEDNASARRRAAAQHDRKFIKMNEGRSPASGRVQRPSLKVKP
jgi:hypothetical protein